MEKKEPEKFLSIVGHLEDLRWTIISSLIYVLSGTVICAVFCTQLLNFVKIPAKNLVTFIVTKPTETIIVYFKLSIYLGAVISLPFVIHRLWRFVRPALGESAPKKIYIWFVSVFALFILGTIFTYYVLLPFALTFLINISKEVAVPMFSLNSYVSFVLALLVAGGITFEMPVVSAFLTSVGMLTPAFMRKKWREAYFAMAVFAAVITPTTDVFNMLLFFMPMLALYEFSIFTSYLVLKRSKHLPEDYNV
jgi:sec-independent protein translocase protein TatC